MLIFLFLLLFISIQAFSSEIIDSPFLDFLNKCETDIEENNLLDEESLESVLKYYNDFENISKSYDIYYLDKFFEICKFAKEQEIESEDFSISKTLKQRKKSDIIGSALLGSGVFFAGIAGISSLAQEINYSKYNLSTTSQETIKYRNLSKASGTSLVLFSTASIITSLSSIYFFVTQPDRDYITEIKYNMKNFKKGNLLR